MFMFDGLDMPNPGLPILSDQCRIFASLFMLKIFVGGGDRGVEGERDFLVVVLKSRRVARWEGKKKGRNGWSR